ncbi:twin-arginine translocation signal domain-containing protein, partial [Parasulfuritortus cantonensis]
MSEHDKHAQDNADNGRRDFLKLGAGAAGVALAPGVLLYGINAHGRAPDQPASAKQRWGMLIDT